MRLGVEKFQRGEWTSEEKTGEQEFIKSAEDEIKAKAAKKAALKREFSGSEDDGTSAKKSNLIEVPTLFIEPSSSEIEWFEKDSSTQNPISSHTSQVTLQMMKDRNEEFDSKMNSIERASKELRFTYTRSVLFKIFTT